MDQGNTEQELSFQDTNPEEAKRIAGLADQNVPFYKFYGHDVRSFDSGGLDYAKEVYGASQEVSFPPQDEHTRTVQRFLIKTNRTDVYIQYRKTTSAKDGKVYIGDCGIVKVAPNKVDEWQRNFEKARATNEKTS